MIRRLLLAAFGAAFLCLPAHAQRVENGYGNFNPNFGGGQTLSATTTSSSVTLSNSNDARNSELMIYNSGSDLAFCRWGTGAQTAVVTDLPIPSGTVQVFTKGTFTMSQGTTFAVACRTSTTTATLYIITGYGR